MPSPAEIQTPPEAETIDRRQEVLFETMGLSSYDVRMMSEGGPHADEPIEHTTQPAAQSPRRRSRRGGRGYPELTDRDIELRESLSYVPSEEELAAAARPDDPGWREARAVADSIAEEALVRRAIDSGKGHILPAIQRARAEKRARGQGKPLH